MNREDFRECDVSGQLVYDGKKGQYWIDEQAWTYLDRVTPTPNGPAIEKLGVFHNLEDAIESVERQESGDE